MKVSDAVIKVKDLDLIQFAEEVQTILNNGLVETRVVTSVPSWDANDGETAILWSGTTRALYFRAGGIWLNIGFNTVGSLMLFDNDMDTGITPEYTLDEDIIRYYTEGVYKFAMSNTFGFAMSSNTPVCFNGTDESVKWVYDSADSYMKCYVAGAVRMEM
jgi:hypothetical protein